MHQENNHQKTSKQTTTKQVKEVTALQVSSAILVSAAHHCNQHLLSSSHHFIFLFVASLIIPSSHSFPCSSLISTEQMFHQALDWIMVAFLQKSKRARWVFGIRCPPFSPAVVFRFLPALSQRGDGCMCRAGDKSKRKRIMAYQKPLCVCVCV